MRRYLVIVLCTYAVCVVCGCRSTRPSEIIGDRSFLLRAFGETPVTTETLGNRQQVYRVFYSRTFVSPILFRVEAYNPYQFADVLTVKMTDGKGGYTVGDVVFEDQSLLVDAGWLRLLADLLKSLKPSYWTEYDNHNVLDGSSVTIELHDEHSSLCILRHNPGKEISQESFMRIKDFDPAELEHEKQVRAVVRGFLHILGEVSGVRIVDEPTKEQAERIGALLAEAQKGADEEQQEEAARFKELLENKWEDYPKDSEPSTQGDGLKPAP